jgi:hypothetical protein
LKPPGFEESQNLIQLQSIAPGAIVQARSLGSSVCLS